ncbi:hypothetical protein X975_18803, partial [Stegodyphus mimosarum]
MFLLLSRNVVNKNKLIHKSMQFKKFRSSASFYALHEEYIII